MQYVPVHNATPTVGDHDVRSVQPGEGVRTFPILYHRPTDTLYHGTTPGLYHVDMIDGHPQLNQASGGSQNYFGMVDSGWNSGRLRSDGRLDWYNAPHPTIQNEIHKQLGVSAAPQPNWADYDWEDEPAAPEQPRNLENIWKNSYDVPILGQPSEDRLKVTQIPGGKNDRRYMWRRPVRYYPTMNMVTLGDPGAYHYDLGTLNPSFHDGFVSVDHPGHRSQYPDYSVGMGWFTHPGVEGHQKVQQALGEVEPYAKQDYVDETDRIPDDLWDDDEVPMSLRGPGGKGFFLGSSDLHLVDCPWKGTARPGMGFARRTPFRYDMRKNTIYLGQPGMFHYHIGESPMWEGSSPLDYREGYVWNDKNTVDWYGDPPPRYQDVHDRLGQHFGVQLTPQKQEDYADDSFWDDD